MKNNLFGQQLHVINIGVDTFAESMEEQKVKVIKVKWSPPALKDKRLQRLLKEVM